MRDEVSNHFGVGIGGEHVAGGGKLFAQRFVVFDDAVVHHRQPARDVRVRVAFAGRAVRGPARVRNAAVALCPGGVHLRRQFGDAADGAQAQQPGVVNQRQAGRVVAAVFELAQAFDEDGNDIAVGDRGNDATHG